MSFSIVVHLRPDLTVLARDLSRLSRWRRSSSASDRRLKATPGRPRERSRNNRSANRRTSDGSIASSPRAIFSSWRRLRSRSCSFSAPDYFSAARSRPADCIRASIGAAASRRKWISPSATKDEATAQRTMFAALHRVRELPGVRAAALTHDAALRQHHQRSPRHAGGSGGRGESRSESARRPGSARFSPRSRPDGSTRSAFTSCAAVISRRPKANTRTRRGS